MKSKKIIAALMLFTMFHLSTLSLFAADAPAQHLGGRVFEEKNGKKEPLAHVPVRIVNSDTGEGRDTKTNKNGCYIFKNIPVGTYSFSINYNNKDFALADKIGVRTDEKLFACVLLKQEVLTLIQEVSEKNRCKCTEFPILWVLLGAAATGGVIFAAAEGSPEKP